MKTIFSYKRILSISAYALLITQIFAHTFDSCYWMVDAEFELIELSNAEDNETEKEDKKEEIRDRSNVSTNDDLSYLLKAYQNLVWRNYTSHDPEINTPPPESLI